MKRVLLSLLLFAFMQRVPADALAQEAATIPPDLLELDFQQCRRECLAKSDEASCDFLCKCSTVEEFPKKMSFEQYLQFRQQIAENRISPDMSALLAKIGQICFERFKASGMIVGPPARPQSEQSPEDKP